MSTTAKEIIKEATSWIGCAEFDETNKAIIDIYNSFLPHPINYELKDDDHWCAAFVSACVIKTGATDIIPVECSCNRMLELFKEKGIWVEDDNYMPTVGDIIMYDWNDDGIGDCKGKPTHVGIVSKTYKNSFQVIEGNYKDFVQIRFLKRNARFIRGFGVPHYTHTIDEFIETL